MIVVGAAGVADLAGAASGDRTTLVVNWDGSGDYFFIQAALDAAGNDDTVIVMPSTGSPNGAYVENLYFPSRAITLRSSDPDDPAVVAATVIDGGGTNRVVTFAPSPSSGAVVSGFTIRNGYATQGGGIRCANGAPTIRNCVITANSAEDGGGMLLWNGSVAVVGCTVVGNAATSDGGGIAVVGYNVPGVHATITDCQIGDNNVSGDWTYGGGISIDGIDATVTGCTISGNAAGEAAQSGASGGGIRVQDGNVAIVGCTITGNNAAGNQVYGGGLDVLGGSATLTDTIVTGNTAIAGEWCFGGGIGSSDGDLTITGGEVSGNVLSGGGMSLVCGGGGVYAWDGVVQITDCTVAGNISSIAGGGVYCGSDTVSTLSGCTIAGNAAMWGGGVAGWGTNLEARSCMVTWNYGTNQGGGFSAAESTVTAIGCTVALNATDEDGFGGGIAADDCVVTIADSILWADAAAGGAEISLNYWSPDVGSHASVSYSDVQGGQEAVQVGYASSLTWLAGNIEVDPQFADLDGPDNDPNTWADNDFHLTATSLCLNTGDPSFTPLPGETDIDGEARVQYCHTDMGADESPWFVDCNGNEEPDACDLDEGTSEDCNGNFIPDECDIADGTSTDCNGDAVPDECEYIGAGDFDGDWDVDVDDHIGLSDCMAGPGVPPAPSVPECAQVCLQAFDTDLDGDVDLADFAWFQEVFTGSGG